MNLKKSWFYYLCMSLAIIGFLYILVCGFMSLGEGQEYPYLPKGMLLVGIFAVWVLVSLMAAVVARIRMTHSFHGNLKVYRYAEIIFVLLILAAAAAIRIAVISAFPMQPASDYKTYYEIAVLLQDGTIQKEGRGYSDYIAMFPHVMGYCYILKTLFSIVGASVAAGQYLNVFFSVMTVFFVYKIAKKLAGRTAGLIALVLCAFWPSQVLYITMLSAEYSFTFFLFLCIWIFLSLVKDYDGDTKLAGQGVVMHLILGVFIGLASAIRPMALILLAAMILTILPQKMKLPPIHRNNVPLTLRMLEKGWIRCILIIIPYMIVSNVVTTNIELTVDRTLPSASTSFGYNLLVGLNTESKGGWNEEDAALLYASMEASGSATQAHITCRDLAFQRLTNNPKGIFNLFVEKYELLWGNDDYGATWNIAFLDEQGNLTQERSDFLYAVRDMNNIFYMIIVFMALITLVYLWKEKGSFAYLLVLLFLGTVAMHLFVESQNRYHYFILQVFTILSSMSVPLLYEDAKRTLLKRKEQSGVEKVEAKEMQEAVESYQMQESMMEEMRAEAYSNVFDMKAALENGNVIMTVSQAYQEEEKPEIEETEKTAEIAEEIAEREVAATN
ncbi:ArnT family glycosyltransferase [Konateibacter massiliensis]|uniref:ArnT family glycosyltransferase n=1 Tax=Konateibacter massiliensis TaxID=2002841 RepID=UPI000C145D91|nr:glycosyltransferase family 39 protein [Konateibacter massiliensis]